MTGRRLFENPWWIVVGSTLALVVGNGPVSLFSFGVFLKPVSSEFGWDRGTMTGAHGLATLFSAICVPIVGIMIDRWGIKRVMLPIVALYGLSIAALSLTTASAVVFMTLYAVTGIAGAGQGPLPYVKSISAWFDERRGLALGIAMAGIGIGVMIVPQIVRFMIQEYGWRTAYVGLGGLMFLVAFPSLVLFVREPEEGFARRRHRLSQAADVVLPGLSVREVLTGSRFWVLALSVLCVSTVVNGTAVHIVPLLTDRGLSLAVATSMLGAFGLGTLAGRLLSGYLVDRFFAPYIAAIFFLLGCVGIGLIISGAGGLAPLCGIIFLGLAAGTEVDMMGFLTSRYFGLRRFGELYGYIFAIFAVGAGLGPYVLGICFDRFHSYNYALFGYVGLLVLASALMVILGPYVFPVEKTEAAVGTASAATKPVT
ncbi:MAG: MFS transporter [Rhodospirillales bacterium]|nr:MFS transporter [Rhodospirillales bacterium]